MDHTTDLPLWDVDARRKLFGCFNAVGRRDFSSKTDSGSLKRGYTEDYSKEVILTFVAR
jgi:hypothetical protein